MTHVGDTMVDDVLEVLTSIIVKKPLSKAIKCLKFHKINIILGSFCQVLNSPGQLPCSSLPTSCIDLL